MEKDQETPSFNIPGTEAAPVKEEPATMEPTKEKPTKTPRMPKKKNTVAICLGILAGVLAIAAIVLGVLLIKNNEAKEEQKCEEVSEKVEIVEVEGEPVKVVTVSDMANEYKEIENVMRSITSGMENYGGAITTSSGLMYKPEGMNTYMPMRFALEMRISNSQNNEANVAALQARFANNGFSSLGVVPFIGSAGPQIFGFLKGDTVCEMYADTIWNSANSKTEYVSMTCAKTSWFWMTAEEKLLAEALATAFRNKTGEDPSVLSIPNPENIKNSAYEPYQTIAASTGGAAGLFYRVSPSAEWQYFTSTQGMLECSDYNTDDLKRAYLGDPCFDGPNNLTVEL